MRAISSLRRSPSSGWMTQLWVEYVDAMQRMMDSREFREGSWPDAEKFLDLSLARSFVAQEHQVIWPA